MRARIVPFVVLLAAACGKPATPAEVRAGLLDNLPPLVADLNATGEAVADSEMATELDGTITALQAVFPAAFGETVNKLPATQEELEANLRETVETIFSDANHEGDGVYRVHGDIVCGDSADLDYADCVADVEAIEIRIHAEVDGDEVTLTLLIGPQRADPLSLTVGENVLEVTADLAGARGALLHIASVTGDELELPGTMKGRISASLRRNAPLDWTAALAIRQAIEIVGTLDAGEVSINVAARDPLLSLRANGNTKELTATVDVGPIQVTLPWQAIDDTSTITSLVAVDLRGLTGTVTLADGQRTLTLENVGFGDGTSTVKLGGVTLIAFDFNADLGRAVDITFTPVVNELPLISFSPGFALSLALDFRPFADAGETVDPALLHETYAFSTGTVIQPVAATATFPGGLKAVTGAIHFTATNAGTNVTVPEGQCLVDDAAAPCL